LEDIFELQDKVAISVAGVIEPTLQAAEIRRSAERPTSDLTAYDLYLRATSHSYTWEKGGILAALDLLAQATERDPQYGPALALAAMCQQNLHINGWTEDPETGRCEAINFARRALRVAGDDPYVLGNVAYVLGYFGEDIDAAIELIDRALAFNPSFAIGWQRSGWLRLWTGAPDLAIKHFETALRLSPRDRLAGSFMAIGVGHFFARRFEEAAAMLLRSLQEHAGWAPTYRFLAACYAHMGQLDEAQVTVRRLRAVTPIIVPSAAHWRKAEHRELFLSGLRLAAGETAQT
jgi:adenylate cyclase